MKKLFYILLTVVLMVSVLAIPAHADGGVTVTITSEKTVSAQDTITFTISVSNPGAKKITGIKGTINPTAGKNGLVYEGYKILCYDKGFDNKGDLNFSGGNLTLECTQGVTATSFDVIEVTYRAKKDVNTSEKQTISFAIEEIASDDSNLLNTTITSSEVEITHNEAGDHTDGLPEDSPAATCTTAGNRVTKCQYCGAVTKEETLPALGHKFDPEPPVFDFSRSDKDNGKVSVTVKCTNTNCDQELYNGGNGKTFTESDTELEVIRVPKDATCTSKGSIIWHAVLTLNDKDNGTITFEDDSDSFEVDALMHDWDDPTVTWNVSGDTKTATAERECKTCHITESVTAEATKDQSSKAPTCLTRGYDIYTADFDFSKTDNATYTKSEQQHVNGVKSEQYPVDATGHNWDTANATWKWSDPDANYENNDTMTAAVTVKCKNPTCDGDNGNYYSTGLTLNATVTNETKAPTCDTPGSATFKATAHTKPTSTGNEEDVTLEAPNPPTESYAVLGHAWSKNNADVTVDWKGDVGTFTGSTATRTCTRDKNHKQETTEFEVTPTTKNPTYSENGRTTYAVSFKFAADTNPNPDNTKWTYTDNTQYEDIPALEPKATIDNTRNDAPNDVTAPAQSALPTADAVKQMVQDAIAGNNTGLDAALEQALKDTAAKSEDDGMTVVTKLVIEDKNDTPAVAIPNLESDTTIKDVYDIHIDVTVNGGGLTSQVGHIEQTAAAIPFTVTKPADGGPIYVVMRYHGDKWEVIPSTTADKISFSSNLFSEFAILSSSDLKYATIEPIPDQTYTGSAIQPKLKVTINGGTELVEGEDYVVEYANNVNVGSKTATATIKPADDSDYSGEQTVSFSIVAKAAAASSNTSKTAPATGDETPVALYAGILTLSAAALAVVCIRRKKTH